MEYTNYHGIPSPTTQVTSVEVIQDGLRLSVCGGHWRLTREVSRVLIADGSCETFEGAVYAGTMEGRLYIPTFNMRVPRAKGDGI